MSFRSVKGKSRKEHPKKETNRQEIKYYNPAAKYAPNVKIKPLPLFNDCKPNQRQQYFLIKLQQCGIVCNFSDSYGATERDLKTQTLAELGEYITQENILTPAVYQEIIKMVGANIFRPLPEVKVDYDLLVEPEDPYDDPAWPHLELVYQIFLKFLESPDLDADLAGRHMDEEFLIQFLETFNTKDSRERSYLKTALHRLYGKLLTHRAFIRQHISNIFLRFIYETENMNGIAELLEFFGSIINGFVLPLKLEHKVFLQKVLVPLFKPLSLSMYYEQVIDGLLRFWPMTNTNKQVVFLNVIEDIITRLESYLSEETLMRLFRRLAQCIESLHLVSSQRALSVLTHEDVLLLIDENYDKIVPLLLPALNHVNNHWSDLVHEQGRGILKTLEDMHPDKYKQFQAKGKKS